MFDGADDKPDKPTPAPPAEPDWKAIAHLVMQQRDRAEQKANNLEVDLALARQREIELRQQIAEQRATAVEAG